MVDTARDSNGGHGRWLALPARPLGVVVGAMPMADAAAEQRCQGLAAVFVARRLAIFCVDVGAVSAEACEPRVQQLLVQAVAALHGCDDLAPLPFGLFGMGPAAAAALLAAVAQRARLQAVVACGGRLEPAYAALPLLSPATLLIVGGDHAEGLASHSAALRLLPGLDRQENIQGAPAGQSDPGCFETMLHHAAGWFGNHLARRS